MDIQAEKMELAKMILGTEDTALIDEVKSLFNNRSEDWWSELHQTNIICLQSFSW